MLAEMPAAPRFDSGAKAVPALERQIDDRALLHTPTAIAPAKRDVHHEVEGPKTFAALRRSPYNGEAGARQDFFNQIG